MTPENFMDQVAEATEAEDIAKLEELGQLFVEGGAPSLPFQPDIRLQGQKVDSEEESALAMNLANGWARSYRLALTDAGEALVRRSMAAQNRVVEAMLGALTPADVAHTRRVMERVGAALDALERS